MTCCTLLSPFFVLSFVLACFTVTNRCKIIFHLRELETYLAIRFTFVYLLFLVVDSLHLLEFFFASFVSFTLYRSFFSRHLCSFRLISAHSVDLLVRLFHGIKLFGFCFVLRHADLLNVLSRFSSSSLSSRIPITILFHTISLSTSHLYDVAIFWSRFPNSSISSPEFCAAVINRPCLS